MRCGELSALNIKDINLKIGTISISKTYHRHDQNDVIKSPKTAGGTRLVTIPPFLTECLKEYIDMGFSPYLIAERIGDSVDMVNNIYGHLYPNKRSEVANKLQDLVSK